MVKNKNASRSDNEEESVILKSILHNTLQSLHKKSPKRTDTSNADVNVKSPKSHKDKRKSNSPAHISNNPKQLPYQQLLQKAQLSFRKDYLQEVVTDEQNMVHLLHRKKGDVKSTKPKKKEKETISESSSEDNEDTIKYNDKRTSFSSADECSLSENKLKSVLKSPKTSPPKKPSPLKKKNIETNSDSDSGVGILKNDLVTNAATFNDKTSNDTFNSILKKTHKKFPPAKNLQSDSEEDFVRNVEISSTQKQAQISNQINIIENTILKTADMSNEDGMKSIKSIPSLLQPFYEREDLEVVTKKCTIKADDDAEIFLIHVPKTLNPKLLENCDISTRKETKISTDSGKFILKTTYETQIPRLTLSRIKKNRYGCKMFEAVGSVLVYQKLKSKSRVQPYETSEQVEFPDKLVERHPLFGRDYSKKIELDDSTKEKLDNCISFHLKKKKKHKHKKLKREKIDNELDSTVSDWFNNTQSNVKVENFDEVFSDIKKKHKKIKVKREKSDDETVCSPGDDNEENMKLNKHNRMALHSTMLNELVKTPVFDPEQSTISAHRGKSKKKKKDKQRNSQDDTINALLDQLKFERNSEVSTEKRKADDDTNVTIKKKKKDRLSY